MASSTAWNSDDSTKALLSQIVVRYSKAKHGKKQKVIEDSLFDVRHHLQNVVKKTPPPDLKAVSVSIHVLYHL